MLNKPPNIVMIMTDQQRADTIQGLGAGWMTTPAMDRLVVNGVSFRQAFCCGATCISSRAALFTGMYPHNIGVYSFDNWAHQRTWLHDFREAGYHLINIGKMHHSPIAAPMAFHERVIVENKTSLADCDAWKQFCESRGKEKPRRRHARYPDWGERLNALVFEDDPGYVEDEQSDMFVGDRAMERLERWDADSGQPLFMQIGFPGPHEPYDPPRRFYEMYQGKPVPPRIFREGELKTKPEEWEQLRWYFGSCEADALIRFDGKSDAEIAEMRRHYYANITGIDEKIGGIIEILKRKEMLENTIIVFTSDHGDNLGDHDMPYKWVMPDSVVRVPLVICTPQTIGKPCVIEELMSQMDIGPTLLELAGLDVPTRLDGRSRAAIVAGGSVTEWDDAVFCEDNYLTMIRTSTAKLVYYAGQDYGELYDLETDPDEVVNLWDDVDHLPLRMALESRLLAFLTRSVYMNSGYKTQDPKPCYRKRFPQTNAPGNRLLQGSFDTLEEPWAQAAKE